MSIDRLQINKAKEKLKKQQENAKKRVKELAKKRLEKQNNRKKNKFCKNEIEFITQEDIEDIPTKELTFIKLQDDIYCLDKNSFKNMIKFAKDQKVRGNCKPPIINKPLECDLYYPINIGYNVYINEKNYNDLIKNIGKKNKFEFKNKRVVNFTTGLHMVSEKTGEDNVYDLVPSRFGLNKISLKLRKMKKKKKEKKLKEINKKIKNILIEGENLVKQNKDGSKKIKKIILNDIVEFTKKNINYKITIIKTSKKFKRKFYLSVENALKDYSKNDKIVKYEPRISMIDENKVQHYFYLSNE
jgi:hypothetical protein